MRIIATENGNDLYYGDEIVQLKTFFLKNSLSILKAGLGRCKRLRKILNCLKESDIIVMTKQKHFE